MERRSSVNLPSLGKQIAAPQIGVAGYLGRLFLSLRPIQWTKNLLILVPFLFSINQAWQPEDLRRIGELLGRSLIALLLFCALSGAVYLINDILDKEADQQHPGKRERPIASGQVSTSVAVAMAVALIAASVGGAFALSLLLGLISVLFVCINLAYSLALKRVVLLDIFSVSSGYVIRLAAGSVVIDVETSPWLYLTIGIVAFFLVSGKRYGELVNAGDKAVGQRSVLRDYSPQLLGQHLNVGATSSLLAYGLYTFTAPDLPQNHSMMLTVPIVAYGLLRYLWIVSVKGEGENPEVIILRDPPLLMSILLWTVVALLVLAIGDRG